MNNSEHVQNISDLELIRKSILDREEGAMATVAWIPIPGTEEFVLTNVTYYYSPIEGTPFR